MGAYHPSPGVERWLVCDQCIAHESYYYAAGAVPPGFEGWPVLLTKAVAVRQRVYDDDEVDGDDAEVSLAEWDALTPDKQELAATLLIDNGGAGIRMAVEAAKRL